MASYTRNLYSIPSVGATALHAIQHTNSKLAVQCLNELQTSGEDEYAFQIATLAWLFGPPSGPKSYAYIHSSRATFIHAVCSNCVAYTLPLLDKSIPDTKPEIAKAATAIQGACKRKDIMRAVYLARPYHNDLGQLFEALNVPPQFAHLVDDVLFAPLVDRVVLQAFAYKITPAPPSLNTIPKSQGRCFQINPAACALWNVELPQRPMNPAMIYDKPSAYWQAAIDRYGITKQQGLLMFRNDDDEEEFYAKYFPHDLPDEWSLGEQQKSHGFAAADAVSENPWRTAFLLL
jgi:hypothetical protein